MKIVLDNLKQQQLNRNRDKIISQTNLCQVPVPVNVNFVLLLVWSLLCGLSIDFFHSLDTQDSSIQHGPLQFSDPCVRMRWTDHSDTFLKTFSLMYNEESYTDVTLVAETEFFKAHRVILSSASELFHQMFKATPHGQHPLIFLKDVKAVELRILLDFIYKGEVAIPPSLIPALVKVGGELKIRGLCDFVWNDSMAASVLQGFQNCKMLSEILYYLFHCILPRFFVSFVIFFVL